MNYVEINNDWFQSHFNKFYDIDGVFGSQCVDLFKQILKELGHPNPAAPIGGDGFAHYIWYNRNWWADYFDFIPKGQIKYGDIIVFSKGGLTPYSHVAVCAGYTSTGQIISFGQNQGGLKRYGDEGAACNYCYLPLTTLLGGLRIKRKGKVVWNYDAVLKVGDIVSSKTLPIQGIEKKTGLILVNDLGGWVPACDLHKVGDDQIIRSTDDKVWLEEARVEMVNARLNLVMVNGYFVKAEPLCRKEYKQA